MLPILLLGDKMDIKYCYITDEYYKDHPDLQKILDIDDDTKHNIRTHLCLSIKFRKNTILIPLRKNIGECDRKFGKIGYPVPSQSKPKAGLDYRYIMIINEKKYLRYDTPRITNRQSSIIQDNYKTIEKEAINYILAYIRSANRGKIERKARFRESSLINFHKELCVVEPSDKVIIVTQIQDLGKDATK